MYRARLWAAAAITAAAALLLPGVAIAAPAPLVTAAPLPTPVTNGTVWALEYAAGVVYAGGLFTTVTPPGGRPQPRHNLAAFSAATGALLPWAPIPSAPVARPLAGHRPDVSCTVNWAAWSQVCDTVYELRAYGGKLYAAGDFQAMSGQPRSRIAAFSLASGALDPGFRTPPISGWAGGRVLALAIRPGAVYAGGLFREVAGRPRLRIAAFNSATGALYDWAPTADRDVTALAIAGGRLILGGVFDRVNGQPAHALAAVGLTSPALARFGWRAFPATSHVTDLVTDGRTVYAAAEGSFDGQVAVDAATGDLRWINGCRGATWALAIIGGTLYDGSHHHDCSAVGAFGEQRHGAPGDRYYRLTAQPLYPAGGKPRLSYWFPTTDAGDMTLPADRTPSRLGPRVMTAAAGCLWAGGQFTTVNGRAQRSLTRFCPRPAPSSPPSLPPAPAVSAVQAGAWVRWRASEDLDDNVLTYTILRNGRPVWSGRVAAAPWDRRVLSWTHTEAPTGDYRVRVTDGRTTLTGPATHYRGN